MKKFGQAVVGLFVGSSIFIAQFSVAEVVTFSQRPVSVSEAMAAVMAASDPIPADQVPTTGTFYSAKYSGGGPPMPSAMGFAAWDLGNGNYLVDDLDEDNATLSLASSEGMMSMMSMSGPPSPGEGGGSGGGTTNYEAPNIVYSGLNLLPPVVATNLSSLTLTITNATSGAQYDLFADEDLNNTNWLWVCRTTTNQIVIPVYSIPTNMCFFLLGTMQDSDNDGITDAFAHLAGLYYPNEIVPGLKVVDAMRQGRNLQNPYPVADTNGVAGLDVFTVLR
jgi:hypothetical protein